MGITEQLAAVVSWLNVLEPMSDEDYETQDYWNTQIVTATGGEWLAEFLVEIGLSDPDRYTAIGILKNFRQIQCVFAFTETTEDLP